VLNLQRRALGFERQSRGLAEILPWLVLIRDGLVLNKDGSLLACYQLNGMAVEGVEDSAVDHGVELFEQSLRNLDHRFTVWSTVLRKEWEDYPEGAFARPGSAAMDALHRVQLESSPRYRNRHYISVLFSQEDPREGLFAALFHSADEVGGSLGKRFADTALRRLFHGSAFQHDQQQLQRRIDRFEELLSHFVGTLLTLGPQRLAGTSLTSFLHETSSPNARRVRAPEISPADYLDTALGEDRVVVNGDHVRFEGVGPDLYGGALAIKGWPGATFPRMLDAVLSIPAEMVMSQVFRFVDPDQAKSYIKNVQRFHLNLQKSLFSYVREALVGEESAVRDTGRAVSAEDARNALTDMAAERRMFGYYNFTVLVMATSREALEEKLGWVAAEIRAQGFLLLRERLHLNSAWSGTLPGQWGELVRWHFVSTANWADLCPIRADDLGQGENRHLARQTGRSAPALSLFPTQAGSPYHFNLHHHDLAHTFVVGPSRSGKSVWVNFIISQFQKYHPVRTLIFDKDRSCRIATTLQGGRCIDPSDEGVRLNPIHRVRDEKWRPWLARWIELLLTARNYRLASGDDGAIWQALEGVAALSPALHQLKSVHGLLPRHLKAELEPWLAGGPMGGYFDHPDDTFSLDDFTCIEMGALLRDHRVARAFLEYAFFRIDQALDSAQGIPTLIYVEEAWFMLSDPYFSSRIRDWLKTIPKKLGSLILATQSLDDLSGSDIFSSIADNIPTRIFLPNRQAMTHRELYRRQFGLNDVQIRRIERAQEKRHYYVCNPDGNQMLEVVFPPPLLAWLRSDAKAQAAFDRHRASGQTEWMKAYLNEMAEERA
jgi:type IV secretion/conjugal transfer VirB4 family ATPase